MKPIKPTHKLIPIEMVKTIEAAIYDHPYMGDKDRPELEAFKNCPQVDLSPEEIKKRSHAFDPYLLRHLGFNQHTPLEVIYYAGYVQCSKDILSPNTINWPSI